MPQLGLRLIRRHQLHGGIRHGIGCGQQHGIGGQHILLRIPAQRATWIGNRHIAILQHQDDAHCDLAKCERKSLRIWEDDMDCCCYCCCGGHATTRRAWMWGTMLASIGTMLGGGVGPRGSTAAAQTAETTSAALDVLRKSISVDVHTHGGTSGVTSKAPPSDDLANGMRAGSLAVACLAGVPDGPVLGRNAAGVLAALRTPEPGQLYQHHLARLAWVDEMVANHGLRRAL